MQHTVAYKLNIVFFFMFGKRKHTAAHTEGQRVKARRRGEIISKTAGLAGCSQYAVVSTDPTEELLQHRLLKKFMLTLIERSQNTQSRELCLELCSQSA